MERNINLNEITDGKRYGLNDLVKVGCNDCKDCSACCQGMGSSIILDPLDIYRLTICLQVSFEELLIDRIELNIVEGLILPNLKMVGSEEQCAFLNIEGRCSIHSIRPGICRIFPLGRIYENGSFDYILQVHECKKENKTKVKVQKWIDTPNIKKNEDYIIAWHYFVKEMQQFIIATKEEELIKKVNLFLLNLFYSKPYDPERSFYEQFDERLLKAKEVIGTI